MDDFTENWWFTQQKIGLDLIQLRNISEYNMKFPTNMGVYPRNIGSHDFTKRNMRLSVTSLRSKHEALPNQEWEWSSKSSLWSLEFSPILRDTWKSDKQPLRSPIFPPIARWRRFFRMVTFTKFTPPATVIKFSTLIQLCLFPWILVGRQ